VGKKDKYANNDFKKSKNYEKIQKMFEIIPNYRFCFYSSTHPVKTLDINLVM